MTWLARAALRYLASSPDGRARFQQLEAGTRVAVLGSMVGIGVEGSQTRTGRRAMSAGTADQVLRLQAELVRLRIRHAGAQGDAAVTDSLERASLLLLRAVRQGCQLAETLRSVRAALMRVGAVPTRT